MQPKYEVPLVPPNLRKEETIVQIAEALAYLSDVSNDIFRRIDGRIAENRSKIKDVTGRIEAAKSKLNKLSGSKKATQVFSCSKYPAADVNHNYRSVFDDGVKLPVKKFPYDYKTESLVEEPSEKLQFFHVAISKPKPETAKWGLGKRPTDVEMANDLLLYNTGLNPYNHYVLSSNTLDGSQGSKHERSTSVDRSIDAAPISISDRTQPARTVGESYFYSPDLGDVPDIDVPLDLPDLPGIADDLRYANETGPGIAPSVATTPNVPELPEILPVEVKPQEIPVVPPQPALPEKEDVPDVVDIAPIAPEPVPEPNPPKESPPKQIPSTETPPPKQSPYEPTDPWKNLMDAIRNAGGTGKLKRVESKKEPAKAPPPSGDLMADLHAKLSMRRKGISGSKKQDGAAGPDASAMDRISAMIPPPPPKQADRSENDDEWDD